MFVHVCERVSEVPTSLSGQMEGQQLLAKNVPFVHFVRHASEAQMLHVR